MICGNESPPGLQVVEKLATPLPNILHLTDFQAKRETARSLVPSSVAESLCFGDQKIEDIGLLRCFHYNFRENQQ